MQISGVKHVIKALLLSVLLLLSACSTIANKINPEPPEVSLINVEPVKTELLNQTFKLTLKLQNPNDFVLAIRGLEFSTDVNEQPFASGVSNQSIDVPAFGEENIDVEVSTNLLQMLKHLAKIGSAKTLDYALSGSVKIEGLPIRLKFKRNGQIEH